MIMPVRGRRLWRILWLGAPLAVFVVVLSRFAELSVLVGLVTGAVASWLAVAFLLQVGFAIAQGQLYRGVFRLLDVDVPRATAIYLALVMAFASLASPLGTVAGVAYFTGAAAARGINAARAALASIAYYLFDYTALMAVVLAGCAVLLTHHDLSPLQAATVGAFAATVLAAGATVVWAVRRPERAAVVVANATRAANALGAVVRRPVIVSLEQTRRWSGEVQRILAAVRARPGMAAGPALYAGLLQALNIATLAATFAAIRTPVPPGVVLSGYAIGTLVMIFSATPSGIGVVEAAMIVVFASLAVPLSVAATATLLYRLFTFWLPMLAGFLSLGRGVPAR